MKKLQHKETGEIGELQITKKHYAVIVGNGTASCGMEVYSSLAELNDEWEDYEEPKGYYYVTTTGLIKYDDTPFCAIHKDRKPISNYFGTREEAEKAVEKLKAWQRLKDKGFEFAGWGCENQKLYAKIRFNKKAWATETEPDLDLLFGGE